MEEKILLAKKDFSRMGFALLVIGVVTTILQVLLALLWNGVLYDTPLGELEIMRWILTTAPMYLVAMPVGLLLMKKIPAESMPAQKLGAKHFWILMLVCMPIMYTGNIIGTKLSEVLSGGNAENALLDYVMGNPLYSFLFTVLLAPLIEEFIFRKQIIDRVGRYGEKTAVVFSALTFGLFHANLFQFFYAFGLGLLFAYVYTRTRMLRYSVFMHMIINFIGSVIAPILMGNMDMDTLTAMENGTATPEQIMALTPALAVLTIYSLLLITTVVVGLVFLLKNWGKHQFSPAACELPPEVAGKTVYRNAGMLLFIVFCLIMMVLALF